MTVEEVKALVPEANVYCLDAQSRYLIVLRRGEASKAVIQALGEAVKDATGSAPIVLTINNPENAIRLLKVPE